MSDDTSDHITDELRDLLAHPGFALLRAHVIDEWGPSRILARQRNEPDIEKWPHFHAVAFALDELLTWPAREIAARASEHRAEQAPAPLVPRRA